MRKVLIGVLVFLLVAAMGAGGLYFFYTKSKTPQAIAARTLKNFQDMDSASMVMTVDTGVKAEVGIFQYFGVKDPETTVNMVYDLDVYRNPAIVHADINVSAFDINAINGIETIITRENDKTVQYYRWNDKWYKYIVPDEEEVDTSDSTSSETSLTNVSVTGKTSLMMLSSGSKETTTDDIESGISSFGADVINFKAILEGIVDKSLVVTKREETEIRDGCECFVFDVDMTGDMLKKIVAFTSKEEGLIPNLKEDEHMTGVLYIDAEKSLPKGLTIEASDIVDQKYEIEQLKTVISIESMNIDINVKEYNIGDPVDIPTDYLDISSLSELDAQDWLGLVLDFTGLEDFLSAN